MSLKERRAQITPISREAALVISQHGRNSSLISSLRLPESTFKEPPAVAGLHLKYSFPSPPPAPDSGFEPLFPRCGSVLQNYGNFRRWHLVGGSRSPGMGLWGSRVAGSLLGSLLPVCCDVSSLYTSSHHRKLCHPMPSLPWRALELWDKASLFFCHLFLSDTGSQAAQVTDRPVESRPMYILSHLISVWHLLHHLGLLVSSAHSHLKADFYFLYYYDFGAREDRIPQWRGCHWSWHVCFSPRYFQ